MKTNSITDKDLLQALLDGETLIHSDNDLIVKLENNVVVIRDIKARIVPGRFLVTTEYWRIKQKTININGFEVPEPLRTAPENGTPCFLTNLHLGSAMFIWNSSNSLHNLYLSKGILHLYKENAELHAKALLSFTNSKQTN